MSVKRWRKTNRYNFLVQSEQLKRKYPSSGAKRSKYSKENKLVRKSDRWQQLGG